MERRIMGKTYGECGCLLYAFSDASFEVIRDSFCERVLGSECDFAGKDVTEVLPEQYDQDDGEPEQEDFSDAELYMGTSQAF